MQLLNHRKMAIIPFVSLFIELILCFSPISSATDTITQSQPLCDDGTTLFSADESYELGFFSPDGSTNRYVGIWFKNIPLRTVVWVANRESPAKDNSSMLTLNTQGNLVLISHNNSVLWSANTTTTKASSPIVQLLNSGNLVLRDAKDSDSQNYLWQSFDYPSDTLLPGMKLGWDLKKGFNRRLIAWKNQDDPSPGDFSWSVTRRSNPEMVLWKGSTEYFRGVSWNDLQFSAAPYLKYDQLFDFKFVSNNEELYYTYSLRNKSIIARFFMNQTSYTRQRYIWIPDARIWRRYSSVPRDYCDQYNLCGPFGNCVIDESPVCQCLRGFIPKSPQSWIAMDWTQGCVRSGNWSCGDKNKDGFLKFSNVKLPDTKRSWVNGSMTLEQCRIKCLENCNCSAYAKSDVRGEGSGCIIWFGDLIDLRQISEAGQDLYIRLAASEIEQNDKFKHRWKILIIIVTVIIFVALLTFALFAYYRKRRKLRGRGENLLLFNVGMSIEVNNLEFTDVDKAAKVNKREVQLPLFTFTSISVATNNFSAENKLGEGGFGPVYKGKLLNGGEVAIKRLSARSAQGWEELKNESLLIAKLQHNNLVRLLGCCIERDEKMLIYEFMPNKSLDFFLFDTTKSRILDWRTRVRIIDGISQGLLYLHQYSRFRIIHRDLKASNILLDINMNPKISDFGLARMFDGNELHTNRIVGTYGYMSPEYTLESLFSIKSDVFSFGILLLEIISGKKHTSFYSRNSLNLLGYAWDLWTSGRGAELLDSVVEDAYEMVVCRYLNIALLCVQESAEDRPTMAYVVSMLCNDGAVLPYPKPIAFLNLINGIKNSRSDGSLAEKVSVNAMTDSVVEAR